MNAVRDYQVVYAKSGNQVGKTHGAASIAIWFYKCFPGARVYTAAAPPEANLRTILWGELETMYHEHKSLFDGDILTYLKIKRAPKEFICGVTIPVSSSEWVKETMFSGKHAPNELFIIDEGNAVPPEIYKGIESCMSGGHVRLLVLYNPRESGGYIYNTERKGKAHIVSLEVFNHPNVITGENIIPGAVTRDITVRRISQWTRPATEYDMDEKDSFDLPPYLVGAQAEDQKGRLLPPLQPGKYIVEEPAFNYMVLGRYPLSSSHQLIQESWFDAAVERYQLYVAKYGDSIPPETRCEIGFDVAEFGEDENVVAVKYGNLIKYLIYWKGIDTIKSGERGIELYRQYNAKKCNVDGTGIGAGIAPHMKSKGCTAYSVKVASSPTKTSDMGEFELLRDQLWWSYREWLKTCDTAMLLPDKKLKEDSLAPRYEFGQRGKIKVWNKERIKKTLGRSSDRADAVCLLFSPEAAMPGFAVGYV